MRIQNPILTVPAFGNMLLFTKGTCSKKQKKKTYVTHCDGILEPLLQQEELSCSVGATKGSSDQAVI